MDTRTGIAGLLIFPCVAFADGFDYTYVEGAFVSSEINSGPLDSDGDGLGITGSLALNDKFHLVGSYDDQSFDRGIDSTAIAVGAGTSVGLHDDWDFIGRLSYVSVEVDTPFGSTDDDGYALMGGVRGRLARKVELDAGLNYVDLSDSDTSLFVNGRYYLNDRLALGGGLLENDGDTTLSVSVRAQFGRRSTTTAFAPLNER